jgi:hypothetical protein
MEGCCDQHRALELGVSRPPKAPSGRNRSRSPSRGSGSARLAGTNPARRRRGGGTPRRGRYCRGCIGASSLASSEMSASRASPSSRTRRAVTASSGDRPFPGRHITTVGQKHRSPGGLAGGRPALW